jgi:hypothetical protein
MIMLFNQLLNIPHLSGGWIMLAKEKGSLTTMEANLGTQFERNKLLCEWNISWIFYFSS